MSPKERRTLEPQSDNHIQNDYVEKANLMEKLVQQPAGVSFLKWLCRLSGFNRPCMNMEDATRRDMWLTVRRFVPIERLSEIEHEELREHQKSLREMLETH